MGVVGGLIRLELGPAMRGRRIKVCVEREGKKGKKEKEMVKVPVRRRDR